MTEPVSTSLEFPLRYRRAEYLHGMLFDIVDQNGRFLAATNDEAVAKLLTNFANKFMELLEATANSTPKRGDRS